jgi:REP element-mobilizing transposase RayT
MINKLNYKFSYRRRLPHIQPEGATFFATSRLAGSLPVEVIERLRQEKVSIDNELKRITDRNERERKAYFGSQRLFNKWDDALEASNTGTNFLSDLRIANLVSESIQYRNGKVYDLIAFCIMPNHIHLVFTPLKEDLEKYYALSKIMHSLKRYTAQEANLILGRSGAFWQHESYDHIIRDETELERIIKYVLYNPVKAGLVNDPQNWKWTFCKYEF